jgi:hypothetical protein
MSRQASETALIRSGKTTAAMYACVRPAALVVAALLLAGCGAKKQQPAIKVYLTSVPTYPGAREPRSSANAAFASTDWTLPKGTLPSQVYAWYAVQLPKAGWKITDRNETGLRAHRGPRAVSIGVRGRTLEVITS